MTRQEFKRIEGTSGVGPDDSAHAAEVIGWRLDLVQQRGMAGALYWISRFIDSDLAELPSWTWRATEHLVCRDNPDHHQPSPDCGCGVCAVEQPADLAELAHGLQSYAEQSDPARTGLYVMLHRVRLTDAVPTGGKMQDPPGTWHAARLDRIGPYYVAGASRDFRRHVAARLRKCGARVPVVQSMPEDCSPWIAAQPGTPSRIDLPNE